MDIESLTRAHQALVDSVRRLRADLTAASLVSDAILLGMSPEQRSAALRNLGRLKEHLLLSLDRQAGSDHGPELALIEQSIERALARMRGLPLA